MKRKRQARQGLEEGDGKAKPGPEAFEVEFEFFDPEESDFHSVRELLCTGALGFWDLDFSELADSIVEQVNIGTMIKSGSGEGLDEEDEEDAALCGLLTALNLRQFSEKAWCQHLIPLLEEKAKGSGMQENLKTFFKEAQPGLLISERYVNLPLELIPMLHKAVLEDIQWSQTTEHCPSEERPFYFFTHFMLLAKCHVSDTGIRLGGHTVAFTRPEDEALAKAASLGFSFACQAAESKPKRKKKSNSAVPAASANSQDRVAVLCLTRSAYEKVVAGLRKALDTKES